MKAPDLTVALATKRPLYGELPQYPGSVPDRLIQVN